MNKKNYLVNKKNYRKIYLQIKKILLLLRNLKNHWVLQKTTKATQKYG